MEVKAADIHRHRRSLVYVTSELVQHGLDCFLGNMTPWCNSYPSTFAIIGVCFTTKQCCCPIFLGSPWYLKDKQSRLRYLNTVQELVQPLGGLPNTDHYVAHCLAMLQEDSLIDVPSTPSARGSSVPPWPILITFLVLLRLPADLPFSNFSASTKRGELQMSFLMSSRTDMDVGPEGLYIANRPDKGN